MTLSLEAARQLPSTPCAFVVDYPDLPGWNYAEPVIAKQHLWNHKGLIIGALQHSSGLRVLEAMKPSQTRKRTRHIRINYIYIYVFGEQSWFINVNHVVQCYICSTNKSDKQTGKNCELSF